MTKSLKQKQLVIQTDISNHHKLRSSVKKILYTSIDIFVLQKHCLYTKCSSQLSLMNKISNKLPGVGKAVGSLDPIPAIQMSRGYGGTTI